MLDFCCDFQSRGYLMFLSLIFFFSVSSCLPRLCCCGLCGHSYGTSLPSLLLFLFVLLRSSCSFKIFSLLAVTTHVVVGHGPQLLLLFGRRGRLYFPNANVYVATGNRSFGEIHINLICILRSDNCLFTTYHVMHFLV